MTLRLAGWLAVALLTAACTSDPAPAPPPTGAPSTTTTTTSAQPTTTTPTTLDPAPSPISITALVDGYDALLPDEQAAPNEIVGLAASTCQTMAQSQHASQIRYIFAKEHGETVGHAIARLLVSFGCPKYLPQFD